MSIPENLSFISTYPSLPFSSLFPSLIFPICLIPKWSQHSNPSSTFSPAHLQYNIFFMMALTELLRVFPNCSSSFPYWAELAFCFLLQHYNKHAGRDEWLGNKSHNSRRKFTKDQLQPDALWTDPIHLEIRASEKERGRKITCIAALLHASGRECVCA